MSDYKKDGNSEFGFIGKIKELFDPMICSDIEGIGDDCAVIDNGGLMLTVISTDMLVEGIHFVRDKISAYKLGRKSLAVNLSDIAAMGARPTASFMSIGLPKDVSEQWREDFIEGYHSLSKEYSTPLIGGDTTSSPDGIVINITVMGEVARDKIKRRGAAKVGDLIAVTGSLGNSAAGFRIISKNIGCDCEDCLKLTDAHNNPKPYIEEGMFLSDFSQVHAMMDVSDGVASDLNHILNLSKVDAVINFEAIPISNAMYKVAEQQRWNAHELAMTGGEDYRLLFTVSPDSCDDINKLYKDKFGVKFFVIGKIVEPRSDDFKIGWHSYGERIYIELNGYTHF